MARQHASNHRLDIHDNNRQTSRKNKPVTCFKNEIKVSRVETVANKNPRGGLAYTRCTFFSQQQQQLVCYNGLCCVWKISSVCVRESTPSFVYWRRFLISVQRPRWLGEKRWTLLSGEIERDTDKKTRRRRRRPGPALKEKGGGELEDFVGVYKGNGWRGSATTTEWLSLACCFIFLCLYGRRRRLGCCPSQFLLLCPRRSWPFCSLAKKKKKKKKPPTLIGPQDPQI